MLTLIRTLVSFLLIFTFTVGGVADARQFKQAVPGYKYQFPADHGNHKEFKTEWWYYTGHLQATNQKVYGFELTFFRSATPIDDGVKNSPWSVDDLYMAHFAVTEVSGEKYFHKEKFARAGFGGAGADENKLKVWLDDWSAGLEGNTHSIKAMTKEYGVDLQLTPVKPLVVHGKGDGISRKASCAGCASHYYSFTRLTGTGILTIEGVPTKVKVLDAWMDHEFGSNQMTANQVGWDWFSIQLEDGTDVMLYVMRLVNGPADANSSGTIVSPDGRQRHIAVNRDFTVHHHEWWKSPVSGGKYPAGWNIDIPSEYLSLSIKPMYPGQEFVSERPGGVTYWEGACRVEGKRRGKKIKGRSYVELTGYTEPIKQSI